MMNSPLTSEVDSLFLTWHLRHMVGTDALHAKQILLKSGIYLQGERWIRDELRPHVQGIFKSLKDCQNKKDYEGRKNELIQLCEPEVETVVVDASATDDDHIIAQEMIDSRDKRAKIIVELVLACAPYLDLSIPEEVQIIVEALTDIHNYKAKPGTVKTVLLECLKLPDLGMRTNSQLISLNTLAATFIDVDTAQVLAKVAQNRRRRYAIPTQQQAALGLSKMAANDPALQTNLIYGIVCNFLRSLSTASTDELDQVENELHRIIPNLGDGMISYLITSLINPPRNIRPEDLKKQRVNLQRAINLFGEKGFCIVLQKFMTERTSSRSASPLIMALKSFALQDSSYWNMQVLIPALGREITMYDALLETLEQNLPGAELAAQAIAVRLDQGKEQRRDGQRSEVQRLLWSKVRDESLSPSLRASCLWSLVEKGFASRDLMPICQQWLVSESNAFSITALVCLIRLKPDHNLEKRFGQAVLQNKREAIRYCRIATWLVMPILIDLLKKSDQREFVATLIASLGHPALEHLKGEYKRSQDPLDRAVLLRPFLLISKGDLKRYEEIIDYAYTHGVGVERQLAEELSQKIPILPIEAP